MRAARSGRRAKAAVSRYLAEQLESRVLLAGVEMLESAPALFVENRGQWADESTCYALLGSSMTVRFTEEGLDFRLAGRAEESEAGIEEPAGTEWAAFSMRFEGSRAVRPAGYEPMGVTNFMLGEASSWRSEVPSFAGLVYPELYPGVDLLIRGQKGSLKYEFHVDAGVDWRQIQVRYEGVEGLALAEDGSLVVGTGVGDLLDAAPVVYQEAAEGRRELSGRYDLRGEDVHGFEVEGVDAGLGLVIDPELAWGTYLGGGGGGEASDHFVNAVAVDVDGNMLVTGWTNSGGWTSGGWDANYNGGTDAFVVKLGPAGQHLWSTYLGGASADNGWGIAADSLGNVLVTGGTSSAGWVADGWDTSLGGSIDAFVVKLSPDGQHVWSTYLGGGVNDSGSEIATDTSGNVLVAGSTNSGGWVSGGWHSSLSGDSDTFAIKLSPQGEHLWSTYLGGAATDAGAGIAADGSGNVLVMGRTFSPGWVLDGWDTSHNGGYDAFVVKLDSEGEHLWSTFVGGEGDERGSGVVVDSFDNVLLAGYTNSAGWVSGGWDTSYDAGSSNSFTVKLSPEGQHLWSTYLGADGGTNHWVYGIAVDGFDNVLVAGEGRSDSSIASDGSDAFVVKVSPDGECLWSTYVGGVRGDYGHGVAVDGSGNVLVVGQSSSYNWVSGGWDDSFGGVQDAFAAKLSPQGLLLWSTYIGGGSDDRGYGIATDSEGNVLVTGETWSSGWVSGGWDTGHNGGADAFVVKLGPQGQHLWSTYIGGGDGDDFGCAVAVDGSDNVLVTGETGSIGWVSGGWNASHSGGYDAFVIKLSSAGQPLWSTYLGGGGDDDRGRGIAADGAGNVLVTGHTNSANWASGGFDISQNGGRDTFLVKLDSEGQHVWSTYVGGISDDFGRAVAIDGSDSVLVAGSTTSTGWILGGWDTSYNGSTDGFIVKITAEGQRLWSTYIGGANTDSANGIAVDSAGHVLVTGVTSSVGWVSGGPDTSANGNGDAFVVKLSSLGQHLWSTYIGEVSREVASGIAITDADDIVIVGETISAGWVSGGPDTSHNGRYDAFVAKLSPQGQHLWSTYLGGSEHDRGYGVAIDISGNVLVTGETYPSAWVSGGWDTSHNGALDAFVAKISPFAAPLVIGTVASDAYCLRVNPTSLRQTQVFLGSAATGTPLSVLDGQGAVPLALRGVGGEDRLTIDLTYGNPLATLGLSVESGRFALEVVGGTGLLELPSLVIAPGAGLDLGGAGIVLKQAEWGEVWDWVAAGRNGGDWAGEGLYSSLAGRAENAGRGLVMARNDRGDGTEIVAGAGLEAIIVRFGWEGDGDLSGVVDGDDYFRMDVAFLSGVGGVGWAGDWDFDGVVDGRDYLVVDRAFLVQGVIGQAAGAFVEDVEVERVAVGLGVRFGEEEIEGDEREVWEG